MFKYYVIIIFTCMSFCLNAQNEFIGFGFRAGLSLSKLDGPSELGPGGEALETNKYTGGFHIGAAVNFKFTDIFGLRTELVYSQRGTNYTYNGPSYFFLGQNTLTPVTLQGNRTQTIKVSNSYLDIPITAYYKVGYFEFFGGLNTGLLLASSAGGEILFDGTSPIGNPVTPFEVGLDYNYKGDEPGTFTGTTKDVSVDGRIYTTPQFLGAYYYDTVKDGNFYKTLDFGVTAGIAYFLNDGLYLSLRYIHGLNDVDENAYDYSLQQLNLNGTRVARADENKSRSWQLSVGFSF
jgi:hypothetical protein